MKKTNKIIFWAYLMFFILATPLLSVAGSPTSDVVEKEKPLKQAKRIEKLANSKIVQWLMMRAAVKAEKKSMRKELKEAKGDKVAQKQIKEKYAKRIKEAKELNQNIKIGIILVLVGIILTLLGVSALTWVGTIVIIIGLIFIILGLL